MTRITKLPAAEKKGHPPGSGNAVGTSQSRGAPFPLTPLGSAAPSALEHEADRAAERVVGASFAAAAAGPPPRRQPSPPPAVQRKCSACAEEELAGVQRVEAPAAPEPTPPGPTPTAPAGVLVDDGQPVGPGQLSRAAFMATVRREVTAMCDAELAAVGQSAGGCPYLSGWLAYYEGQPAAHIERAVAVYTGVRGGDAAALVGAVVSRARAAVRTWVTTGTITGIPSAAPGEAPPASSPPAPSGAVQTKARESAAPAPAPRSPAALRAELGTGHLLDASTRTLMERGFGRSFNGVRVHTGDTAARLSSGLSARAFTVGQDVAFGAGEYRPGTLAGNLLIAHELAHTVQQRGGGPAERPLMMGGDSVLEEEADRAAVGVLGSELGVAGRVAPREGGGLRLQGCTTKAKACPPGLSWYPASTLQWGSFGCTCLWRCLRRPQAVSTGPAFTCPPRSHCEDPFERVGRDYSATGYGAAFTPLTGPPACGCFPLDLEGNQQSSSALVPVDIDMTTVIGPGADVAAGLKARRSGGPSAPETDPRTGTRIPGRSPTQPAVVHPVDALRSRAITRGVYTPELTPRLEKLFREADPAIMAAMDRTVAMPEGSARTQRIQQLLSWAEGRPVVPETITEGQVFGRGGTGAVAEVAGHPELASKTGAGRSATEAAAMVELELAGIPTVYLAEREVGGAPRLILRRIDGVGSKEIIGRRGNRPEDVAQAREYAQYVTPRTISDLEAIRQRLVDARMNVGDFQFIIRRSDGAVFMNDPTNVTPNSQPSGNIDNIIGQFRAILRRRTEGQTP